MQSSILAAFVAAVRSGTSHSEIKEFAARLSSSIDRLSCRCFTREPCRAENSPPLQQTLEDWPFNPPGRLPVPELLSLAKSRWPVFIQHFLATEIFGVIQIGANAEYTILCRQLVAYMQWASGVKEKDTVKSSTSIHCQIHARLFACTALRSFFSEQGLEQLRQRLNSVLEPLLACPKDTYVTHIEAIISAAQDLGKAFLIYPGYVKIRWEMAKPQRHKKVVLVFPRMVVEQNQRGQLIGRQRWKKLREAKAKTKTRYSLVRSVSWRRVPFMRRLVRGLKRPERPEVGS